MYLYCNSISTDKGFAPLYTGHEPIMLLLHQSAYKKKFINKSLIKLILNFNFFIRLVALEGFEPSYLVTKTLCLNQLDYKANV